MSEVKRVKIDSILESQIPEFLVEDSPLFVEFLRQYYKSLEHQSGTIDLAVNLNKYKSISKFNNTDLTVNTVTTESVLTFSDSISVESTTGWPDSYGLLKIDNEIITYTSKTDTKFIGCIRGFSGVDQIESIEKSSHLNFSVTSAEEHELGSTVLNLSNLFLVKFFEKFKSEFLPGFENRDFNENVSIENILLNARNFYISKGTDTSYKFLFQILYGSDIEVIKPDEYTLKPSSDSYFVTKNVLVEKIFGEDPVNTKGNFLLQDISGIGTISASIFNVEYRPVGGKDLYEISLDSSSISGSFVVTGQTRILEIVPVGADNILVDSTVGFSRSGKILVKPENSDFIELSYTDKTTNQFLGVSGVTKTLKYGLSVVEDKFAYSYIGFGNTSRVDFRIINVIEDINIENSNNLQVGDKIQLVGFGKNLFDDNRFNSWITNVPTSHNVDVYSQETANIFRLQLFDRIIFYKNEEILIFDENDNNLSAQIIDIEYSEGDIIRKFSNTILVQVFGLGTNSFNSTKIKKIQKVVYKTNHYSNAFPNIDKYPSGVQNTYVDRKLENFYVTSTGIPNYTIFVTDDKRSIQTFEQSNRGVQYVGFTSVLRIPDHNYVNGNIVYYATNNSEASGIGTGYYYVTVEDSNNIKLSYSKSDIFSKKYLEFKTGLSGENDTVVFGGYENKNLEHQKLVKKFPFNPKASTIDDDNIRTTNNRPIGMLVNGTELLSPTYFDENIFYGKIDFIEVTNGGRDYDVVNPPPLEITDSIGTGALAHVNLSGSIRQVKVITPGVGYQKKPKINISGGNGKGCSLESNLVKSRISEGFKADVAIDLPSNSISFLTPTSFEDGEEVLYDNNTNSDIVGIVNGSLYYVGIISSTRIKLYNSKTDAVNKNNEIEISGISSGFHYFATSKSKNTITEIYVKDPGEGYSNRTIKVPSILSYDNKTTGINTFDSYIFAPNHGFSNAELVTYNTTGSEISGLSTSNYYHISTLDGNRFKLSLAGTANSISDQNYFDKKYIKFESLGSGTHSISYPPIVITVESVSSLGSTTIITPVIEPVVLGSIDDVYVISGGVGYGCTNIINFHRRPLVGIATVKSEALLKPIVVDGKIVDVKIIQKGLGYRKDSDIFISSPTGNFAKIEPIVGSDGKLQDILIVDPGVGYGVSDTTLTLKNRGSGAKLLANISNWKVDQVVKLKGVINDNDDGVLLASRNEDLGLQFTSYYIPKKLRYQLSDNFTLANKETDETLRHSPILGYAYDGNPIYGPYGYDTPTGGTIRQINTGYVLNAITDEGLRPPGLIPGYFVNDYEYSGSGDLDLNNGRYCVTPEYSNGVYAYFYSVDVDISRIAKNKYPYIVGPQFNNIPVEENFLPSYNQNQNLFTNELTRNTGPYYLNYSNSSYNLIDDVYDEYKQEFRISRVDKGTIEDVSIFSKGKDYKVGDLVDVNNTNTGGYGTNIVVSELEGKEVDEISIVKRFFGDCTVLPKNNEYELDFGEPHELNDLEPVYVSGVSDVDLSSIEKIQTISVETKTVQLLEDIDVIGTTGISTFIKVKDVSIFRDDDFIGIGTEKLHITKIDKSRSGFYVNRLENTGIHTAGEEFVTLLPRRIKFRDKTITGKLVQPNYIEFFNPFESVGTGTEGSLRNVVSFGSSSFETRFIPQQSIYIPGHKFYTGQPLTYHIGVAATSLSVNVVGSGVSFILEDGQTVYAVNKGRDYIGISTVGYTTSTGIGTNLSSVEFWDLSEAYGVVGAAHSLKTQFPEVKCSVTRNAGVVTTKTNHELTAGDVINLKVSSTVTEEKDVYFDSINRKILIGVLGFTNSDVSIDKNTIDISSSDIDLKNGDKVVYYAEFPLGGLENSKIYYVLKKDNQKVALCEFAKDVTDNVEIPLTAYSAGGDQHLYLVNPPVIAYYGSKIKFNLSDPSLVDLNFELYADNLYTKRVELIGSPDNGWALKRSGTPGTGDAYVQLDTTIPGFPSVLFYRLRPVSPLDSAKEQLSFDREVTGFGKVIVRNHPLNKKLTLDFIVDDNTFTFNSDKRLDENDLQILSSSNSTYTTNSESASGSIHDVKINFEGRGYERIPVVGNIRSDRGVDAVLKLFSKNIGRVEETERTKDGFDYPTDPTLSPQLGGTAVIGIKDIRTIDRVGIITGGKNYNVAPILVVKDDKSIIPIKLEAGSVGGSVVNVRILQNSTSLEAPLEIVPTFNSNGYDIDTINVLGDDVTLELLNNPTFNPLITVGYGASNIEFPFKVGDEIFVEKCRLTESTSDKANFNSEKYNYTFFTVSGINTVNYTVTYSMAGISTGELGTYDGDRPGVVVNKKDMASFNMILKDDVKYQSSEVVTSDTYSAKVLENGWENDLNQLRVTRATGELEVGDKLFGQESKTNGTIEYVNNFIIGSTLGVFRDKIYSTNSIGILNDSQQRISDNFYYQKFAYSLRSNVPYSTWRESVRSIVHPSGFQEFSDYTLITEPSIEPVNVGIARSINMRPVLAQSDSILFIKIDSEKSFNEKTNFALVYEDFLFDNGFSESLFIDVGPNIRPYVLNKTNKVINIDDISSQFIGTREFTFRGRYADAAGLLEINREFIQEEVVSFVEFNYPNIGLSTTYSREKCLRDTGFIVDAVAHDLKYNSNNKSVEAGLAYWNAGASYVTYETEETLFAYNYVKFIGQYVINNQTPPTLYQSSVTQRFNFDLIQDPLNYDQSRYKDARNLIIANKREIQDRSLAQVAVNFPDFYFPGDLQTNSQSRYYDGYRLIQQNKQEIIDYAWNSVVTGYPGISTTQTKCRRDLGYFIDAVSLDVFTGGNRYSRKFISFYFDANGDPINNGLVGEEVESVYAFNQARVGMQSAVSNQLTIQDLTVTDGPPIYGIGVTVSNTDPTACTDVQNNIATLVNIVTTAIGAASTAGMPIENVGTYTIGGLKCFRDLGYIIDGVAQDLSYGTNQHTIYNTKKYFDGVGAAITNGLLGEEAESIVVFESAKEYMKQAITNKLYSRDLTITADNAPGSDFGSASQQFTPINATYDPVTGISTITIVNHGLSVDDHINIATNSLTFTCDLDGNATPHTYPRVTDPAAGQYIRIESVTDNTITVNVGSGGTNTSVHTFVSADVNAISYGLNTDNQYNTYLCSDVQSNINNLVGILTVAIGNSSLSSVPSENYGTVDCADVRSSLGNYVGIITTIIGLGTAFAPVSYAPSLSLGGDVVGLSSFKLTNNGTSLFKHVFDSSSEDIIDITTGVFNIINHNYQTGQELVYDPGSGSPIGIATTSYVGVAGTILMEVGNFEGTAILENGYPVGISTDITGISTVLVPAGPTLRVLNSVIGNGTTGTNAVFNVVITYSPTTGNALSTSIVLASGGSGFSVGETVSIAGTYIGGSTPANDLSFVVSNVGPTGIQTLANEVYTDVPSTDGSGALFNVYRDNSGYVDQIDVVYGAYGYNSNSVVSIAGTYLGGGVNDYVEFTPIVLGVDKLPSQLFAYKFNDNQFAVLGLSTSPNFLVPTSLGTENHSIKLKDPNSSCIISIDGIVQPALRQNLISVSLPAVSTASTTLLDVSSGITSLTSGDVINIDNEFILVKNIYRTDNKIEVNRGYLGTIAGVHTVGASVTVLTGAFTIDGDTIYFTKAPYGPTGPVGLQTSSSFSGRVFSRQFDAGEPIDKNIILDDISKSFTGLASTEFVIKTNGESTTTIFNDINSASLTNNNPLIFINNVFQVPGVDFTVDGSSENVLRFLTGSPSAGRISKVSITTSFGYQPRRVATADATVSVAGTISAVTLDGLGSGYRFPPAVSIASTVGTGASIVAIVGTSGTTLGQITEIQVIDGGSGYAITSPPRVLIGIPTGYSNMGVAYTGGTSGVGQDAKLTVTVGQGSSITSFKFDNPGLGYKVGDQLKIVGIPTNSIRNEQLNITNALYDNVGGITTITTLEEHQLSIGDDIRLSGIAFTCGYDEVGIQTFSYDEVSGICTVVTYSPHGLLRTDVPANQTSDEVFLFNLPFSCAAEHAGVTTTIFPDGTSPYGRVFPVLTSISSTSFTMNAGVSTIPHVFEGWPEIGITTFSYENLTGISTATTSSDHGFAVNDKFTLAGLAFTCLSVHAGVTTTIFPDGTSPYGYTFTVTGVTTNTVTFNAGISTIVHEYVSGGIVKKVPTAQRVLRYTDDSTDGAYNFKVIGIPTIGAGTTNTFSVLAGVTTIPHFYTESTGIVSFRQPEEFVVTVEEVQNDTFTGMYPGQFIQFDDISPAFNGFRTKFTLSVTESGIKQILNLNTLEGSDLDITNNIFVFINDVLQIPQSSYTFKGSRIIFKEAPIANSTCSVLYYRGSYRDVEEVTPPETIKPGDKVTLKENKNDLFDQDQTPRTVKIINSSDQLDTFVYGGVGILSATDRTRPITWEKQKNDRIISGALYSKSRPGLRSGVVPNATLIKDIAAGDTEIYVDNAFPMFAELDSLNENLRDITIIDDRDVEEALVNTTVSGASTVSSVNITYGGIGYANTLSPRVTISSSSILRKDPIYNWSGVVVSGIDTTTDQFNALTVGTPYVAVGNSSLFAYSNDTYNWYSGNVGVGSTTNLTSVHSVGAGSSSIIVTVGDFGTVAYSSGYGSTLTEWSELGLFEDVFVAGIGLIGQNPSSYNGTLNSVTYGAGSWVTVGTGGSIFTGPGIVTSKFTSRFSGVLENLNSVAYGNGYFTSVGNNGTVLTSNAGIVWDLHLTGVPLQKFNDIMFDGTRFVIVGDNGTIVISVTRDTYQEISNNISSSENILKISYYGGIYLILTSANKLYYSFDLIDWSYRDTQVSNQITDIVSTDETLFDGGYVSVGYAGTVVKTTEEYHRATAVGSVVNGVVDSIIITDGGFGYDVNNPPVAIVECDTFKRETIKSFKIIGDYGKLVGVNTFLAGTPGIGTTSPKLEFVLQSEQYDNSTLGIGYSAPNSYGIVYSQLSKGDYFIIKNSNVVTDGNLVAISTFLGGMGNYPNSVVGVATNFIDGVYIVENVSPQYAGIVTVTCHFAPDSGNSISVAPRGEFDGVNFAGVGTNGFYGDYSWSKLYDFQNRSLNIKGGLSFETYTDQGLAGLNTSPKVIRTRTITGQ